MPRTAEQSAALREKRRAKILRKSLRLFCALSFDALTIDDIASACNCSHGLFYHYFQSKEGVYNALMEERHEKHPEWECPVKEIKEIGGYEGLKKLFEYVSARLHDDEEAVLYLNLDLFRPMTTAKKSEPLLGEDLHKLIYALVKKAYDDGDITAGNPTDLSFFIIETAIGATMRRLCVGLHDFKIVNTDFLLPSLGVKSPSK